MKSLLVTHQYNTLRVFLFFLLVFTTIDSFTQQVIVGKVIDAKQKEYVTDVQIFIKNRIVAKTSDSGTFIVKLPEINLGTQLEFKHISYDEKLITIDKYYLRRIYIDTLFLNVQLQIKTNDLPEIPIFAEKKPDTVFGSPVYSVHDFVILEDKLLLLAYEQTLHKGSKLLLTDFNQKILSEAPIDIDANKLYKDFRNDIYVLSEDNIRQIFIKSDSIFIEKTSFEVFQDFTSRIIDSIGGKYYYSNFQDIYPAFDFYALNPVDSTAKLTHSVEDKFMMELYRSEYKYVPAQEKLWAMRQEQKTGIDKEIWIGARYFTQSLYYKPNYAPMIVFSDTAYIFDHYSDFLYSINTSTNDKIDSVTISYHQIMGKDKWKQPLAFDANQSKAYALFQNTGSLYLRNINLTTGAIDFSFKLHYRYVDNIKVKNGYVYYIYRPFESAQKKYLYREKLNY